MDYYGTWSENRPKIPAAEYELMCVKAEKQAIWHEGQGSWGRSEKVILWFQVFGGGYNGKVIPMFLTLGDGGKVHQGSKYFVSWCIANGLNRPLRSRLKDMPPSKFENKVFRCEVVDVKPKWKKGYEQPGIFHYSRVDAIYDLIVGDPNY